MSNAAISLRTIIRRWIFEKFKYRIIFNDTSIFEIALKKRTTIAGEIRTTRIMDERQSEVQYLKLFWIGDGDTCIVTCYDNTERNKYLTPSDPKFFEEFKSLLSGNFKYLESNGYILPFK